MKLRKAAIFVLLIVCAIFATLSLSACNRGGRTHSSASDSDVSGSSIVEESTGNSEQTGSDEQSTGDSSFDSSSEQSGEQSGEQSSEQSGEQSGTEPPVVEDEIVIDGVSQNDNLTLYLNNKGEKADKENEFYDREQPYFVGTDNAFTVKPNVIFSIYKDGSLIPEPYYPESWDFVVNVYIKNEIGNYVLLEGADLESYVDEIDSQNAAVDFAEDAAGENFKIEVYPEGLDEFQAGKSAYVKTWEVAVVEGYNVYTALELSYFDNSYVDESEVLHGSRFGNEHHFDEEINRAWVNFKAAKGLNEKVDTRLILQANITVTTEDLPPEILYREVEDKISTDDPDYDRVIGSMKDCTTVYFRRVEKDGDFEFEGNYFTIDASSLPLVKRPFEDIIAETDTYESHTNLFYVGYPTEGYASVSVATGTATFKDVNLIGNAPRVEDTTKCGGLIMEKVRGVDAVVYNNIANHFLISYFPDYNTSYYLVDGCKSYNAFDCHVYAWCANDVHIENCEFIASGGPAMIIDHYRPNDSYGWPSEVHVVNSNIHSYVSGEEAWFIMYTATEVVGQIATMNAGFTPFGKSFALTRQSDSKQYIDLVALYKSSTAEAMTDDKISGYFSVDDGVPMDFGTYVKPWDNFASDNGKATYIETVLNVGPLPIFMSSGGGMSFFYPYSDGSLPRGLNTLTATGVSQIVNPADAIFSGDQLYLYYNRMGIVFNYYNAADAVLA